MDVHRMIRNEKNSERAKERYQHVTFEELLVVLATQRLSKNERKVLFMYEKLSMQCFEDRDKYFSNRWQSLAEAFKQIKKEGLYYAFLSLTSKLLRQLRNDKKDALNFICTELCDTYDLVGQFENKYILGLGHNGKSLIMGERPFVDEYLYGVKKSFLNNNGIERLSENEARLENIAGDIWQADSRHTEGIIVRSAFLVSEKNLRVYPKSWGRFSAVAINQETTMGYKKACTLSYMRERLLDRKYVLNRRGVNLQFPKFFPVESLFLMEAVDRSNRPFLFARVKISGIVGEFLTLYEVNKKRFDWGVKFEDRLPLIDVLENVILESYMVLTCELEDTNVSRPLYIPITKKDSLNKSRLNYRLPIPMLVEVHPEPYDKEDVKSNSKGTPKSEHSRIYTTRKLPAGWNRTARAEDLASLYNVKLKDDETFVLGSLINVRDKADRSTDMDSFGRRFTQRGH